MKRGVTGFLRVVDKVFSGLFFFVLKLVVYSKSKFLVVVFLSLFGVIQGAVRVPKNRVSAAKSLLRYGVEVLQHGF